MCPVRHEDDFRRRPIASWESWVDQAIAEAKERGEFDNLPGHGKPLRVETNPFAPDLDLAHGILKNADMAPPWIELNRAIEAELMALTALREQAAQRLAVARLHDAANAGEPAAPQPDEAPARSWWRRRLAFFRRPPAAPLATTDKRPTLAALAAERARARACYLERAATLDKRIAEYHDALPPTLWHLQRPRLTQDRAARDFDAAVGEGRR